MCKAGHGGTRVSRRVSTDSGRFEEPLGSGMVTPVAATGTSRGAWSRGRRVQKHPSRWCSGRYRLVGGWGRRARTGPMATTGWTIRLPNGPQGASHERRRVASRGTERAALLGNPDSASEEPLAPSHTPPKPTRRPLHPFPGATLSQAPASPDNPVSSALPGPAPSVPRPLPPPPPGEPPGRRPGRGVPLRRRAGRGAHAGGRVPGVRRAAPGRAGAARVSEAPLTARARGQRPGPQPAPAPQPAAACVQPRPCRPQLLLHCLHLRPDGLREDLHPERASSAGGPSAGAAGRQRETRSPGEPQVARPSGGKGLRAAQPRLFADGETEDRRGEGACPIWSHFYPLYSVALSFFICKRK